MKKTEEDIRMLKHVLQIKVCCYLPQALNKVCDIEKFWIFSKKKVIIKKAMKKTFGKHSMVHLLNKNKAFSNLFLNLKT